MKNYHRFTTALMTGTMVLTMAGQPVFAQEETVVNVTKTIAAEDNVLAPSTSFQFSIQPAASDTTKMDGDKVITVYAGVAGGAVFDEDSLVFAPGDDLSKDTSISFDTSVFSKPGVYRYVVTENSGAYDGMSYSTDSYYLDVYVVNGENGFEIAGFTALLDDVKQDGIEFTNDYSTNHLIITKTVEGNQGDKNKDFTFSITVTGADGEQYATSLTDENGDAVVLSSGTAYEFTLKHGEQFEVIGLSPEDTYVVEEEDYSSDGYETAIETVDTQNGLSVSGSVETEDETIAYTNTKDVTTPTGVALAVTPYALMAALAGAFACLFGRKRKSC